MTEEETTQIADQANQLYKILKSVIHEFCIVKKYQEKIDDFIIANAITNGVANVLAIEVGMLCVDKTSELNEQKRIEMITIFMQGIIEDKDGCIRKNIQDAIIFVNQNYKCVPGVH